MALCLGAGTRRNLHPLTPVRNKKKDSHRQQGLLRGSSSLLQCFEPARVVQPSKPAYNQSRPDGQLKLTASTFNQLWISMPTVMVTVPAVTLNSLHPSSTSSIIARQILDFVMHGKITEADALTVRQNATLSGLFLMSN